MNNETKFIKAEELEEFKLLLTNYTEELKVILSEMNRMGLTGANVILANYIERFLYNWDAILLLLPKFYQTFNYNYPIQLIVRGVMIDVITISYLISLLKVNTTDNTTDDSEMLHASERLDYDFVSAMMDLLNDAPNLQEKKTEIIKEYSNSFPQFFKEENGIPTLITRKKTDGLKDVSIDIMFQSLDDLFKSDPENRNLFKHAYFIYRYGSQFQHGSTFTKGLVDKKNNRLNFSILIDTLGYSLLATHHSLKTFKMDEKYVQRANDIAEKVMAFKKQFLK